MLRFIGTTIGTAIVCAVGIVFGLIDLAQDDGGFMPAFWRWPVLLWVWIPSLIVGILYARSNHAH